MPSASPTGIAVPVTVGASTVTGGAQPQPIAASGLSVPVSIGSPTVSVPAGQFVSPTGLSVPVAVGSPSLSFGGSPQTVTATGLAVPVAVGSPTVSLVAAGTQAITPTGLAIPVSFGALSATGGVVSVDPADFEETVITWLVDKRARAIRFRVSSSASMAKLRSLEVFYRESGKP